jgi:hypothetical protein
MGDGGGVEGDGRSAMAADSVARSRCGAVLLPPCDAATPTHHAPERPRNEHVLARSSCIRCMHRGRAASWSRRRTCPGGTAGAPRRRCHLDLTLRKVSSCSARGCGCGRMAWVGKGWWMHNIRGGREGLGDIFHHRICVELGTQCDILWIRTLPVPLGARSEVGQQIGQAACGTLTPRHAWLTAR